jgi:hypothetical protein
MARWQLVPRRQPQAKYSEKIVQHSGGGVARITQYEETTEEVVPIIDDKGRIALGVRIEKDELAIGCSDDGKIYVTTSSETTILVPV